MLTSDLALGDINRNKRGDGMRMETSFERWKEEHYLESVEQKERNVSVKYKLPWEKR